MALLHINDLTLTGNLGDDARKHVFADGNVEFTFRVANSKKFMRQGEAVEKTVWVKVKTRVPAAQERRIAFYERVLRKGNTVFVKGELEADEWVGEGGTKHSEHVVVSTDIQVVHDKYAPPKPVAAAAANDAAPADKADKPVPAAPPAQHRPLLVNGAF